MVAADGKDGKVVATDEGGEHLIQQADRLRRGHRAVIQVTADKQSIDLLLLDDLTKLLKKCPLVVQQGKFKKTAPDMPVRSVQQFHETGSFPEVCSHYTINLFGTE